MREYDVRKAQFTVADFLSWQKEGSLNINPPFQRRFVWKPDAKSYFIDTVIKGLPAPIIYLRQHTDLRTQKTVREVVDGQQRLTALYAVVKGKQVVRENWKSENIEIAFNPLEKTFAVADAAIRRDKTYIPNISELWNDGVLLYKFTKQFLSELGDTRELTEEEVGKIHEAIGLLHNLPSFLITALQLVQTIDVEQVSDVFVRINSKGKKLDQSDFILTLMSVFWDAGRTELETFCREARQPSTGVASSFNHFIDPSPDQLLRVGIGLGFRRARMSIVYSILRGKDLKTKNFSHERRVQQFDILKKAQTRVLNIQYWHDFFKSLTLAGYRGGKMVSSRNALLFTYIIYLLGRTEYDVEEHKLRRVIAQWFFMATLTGRYSSSPETTLEADLARFRQVESADGFVAMLQQVCETSLTNDFWTITLPSELATSGAKSPAMFAYFAALNLLDARGLFSTQKVADLMDPATHAPRSALERHHLFPKKHLKDNLKITDNRDINQIANFTLIEWHDNMDISDKAPDKYMPELAEHYIDQMAYWHALPPNWENMDYYEFLKARRELMAQVIADAYGKLTADGEKLPPEPQMISVEALVDEGETLATEFKSTLRINLHTGGRDPRMELAILRTIAGFINNNGGTLVVGVSDDGTPVGIEADGFENEDKMCLHLTNIINGRIGPQHMMYIHPRFDNYEGVRVLVVECQKGKSAVYVKDGNAERFYIRTETSTTELSGSQTEAHIKNRFQ